jgi:hypothetical protein
MSTRSVVAMPTCPVSWEGRYCHWDGYQSGNGAFIWHSVLGHFGGDVQATIDFFVKPDQPHGAGYWSSLQAAFTEPKNETEECSLCHGSGVRTDQIGQDMGQPTRTWTDAEGVTHIGWCNGCEGTGQRKVPEATGWVPDSEGWARSACAPDDLEYAYVLHPDRLVVFKNYRTVSYGTWRVLESYPWDGPTPTWAEEEAA